MKRTPMSARKEPLERRTPLAASPLARSTLHSNQATQRHQPRRRTATPVIPKKVRVALAERSGGVCEIGQRGCSVRATDFSHRLKVGMGGRKREARTGHDVLSNGLHACRECHSRCHTHPAEAYVYGWMLREHQDPADERVLYRGAWSRLTDAGLVLKSDLTAEEAPA